jgi:hypothetical protein
LKLRRESKKEKRVALEGKFSFDTQKILNIVEKAELQASKKKFKRMQRAEGLTPGNEADLGEDSWDEQHCQGMITF